MESNSAPTRAEVTGIPSPSVPTSKGEPLIIYKTANALFNLLQDSAITKLVVDVRSSAKFSKRSIRNSIHLRLKEKDKEFINEFTVDEVVKLSLEDVKTSTSGKYAWDANLPTVKDCKDWNQRGMLFKNVVLYDEDGQGELVKRLYRLIVGEGRVPGVFILEGGIAKFEKHYPFLISSSDDKTKAVDGAFPSELLPQFLFLGSFDNVKNKKQLQSLGVTHILNMADELENPYGKDEFVYKACGVNDTSKDDIKKYFKDALDFIDEAKKSSAGSKVLVHCAMGISRSSAIAVAWLMKENNWDLQTTIDYVKSHRSCIKPNPGFLEQLKVFEADLKAQREAQTNGAAKS
eukprot:TRINITY_DN16783_c0_g1_i1.p1 TRINITY_DN16783_c0_g1~~TRINITY_DN16783_c0_g1_i1.p1  ORF type:complete len:347 (-),score=87.76 TRINITY_DN16783_c0_g1_i1:166-1206(-)